MVTGIDAHTNVTGPVQAIPTLPAGSSDVSDQLTQQTYQGGRWIDVPVRQLDGASAMGS